MRTQVRRFLAYGDRILSADAGRIWTRERDPLEWAMAQRNLGSALSDLSDLDLQAAPLHAAVTAYQNALSVYQSRSNRLDSANVQFKLGGAFQRNRKARKTARTACVGRWIIIARQ